MSYVDTITASKDCNDNTAGIRCRLRCYGFTGMAPNVGIYDASRMLDGASLRFAALRAIFACQWV
jgi:hypothetical protein